MTRAPTAPTITPVCRLTHLTAVGVGSSVGHGKKPRLRVLQLEVLVLEFFAVDAAAPCPVAGRIVPALHWRLHTTKNVVAVTLNTFARFANGAPAGAGET